MGRNRKPKNAVGAAEQLEGQTLNFAGRRRELVRPSSPIFGKIKEASDGRWVSRFPPGSRVSSSVDMYTTEKWKNALVSTMFEFKQDLKRIHQIFGNGFDDSFIATDGRFTGANGLFDRNNPEWKRFRESFNNIPKLGDDWTKFDSHPLSHFVPALQAYTYTDRNTRENKFGVMVIPTQTINSLESAVQSAKLWTDFLDKNNTVTSPEDTRKLALLRQALKQFQKKYGLVLRMIQESDRKMAESIRPQVQELHDAGELPQSGPWYEMGNGSRR